MTAQNDVWRERHLLPNKAGYTFRGKLENGTIVLGVVKKSVRLTVGGGLHYVAPLENQPDFKYWDLVGWQPI